MGIILYIIFGAIVGWISSKIMGRNEGIVADVIIGIIGSILGSFLVRAFGGAGVTGLNLGSFIVAIIGSVVLLFVVNLFRRGTHHPA